MPQYSFLQVTTDISNEAYTSPALSFSENAPKDDGFISLEIFCGKRIPLSTAAWNILQIFASGW